MNSQNERSLPVAMHERLREPAWQERMPFVAPVPRMARGGHADAGESGATGAEGEVSGATS